MDQKTQYVEKLLRPQYAKDYITDSEASDDEVAPPATPPKNMIRKQYEKMYKSQGEPVLLNDNNNETVSMLSTTPLNKELITSKETF